MPDPHYPELDPLRINLGAGDFGKWGWLNLDAVPPRGRSRHSPAHLTHDLRLPLPFPDGDVDEAYAGHILEHLPKPLMLVKELFRVLAPGAKAGLVVPDADVAWRLFRKGLLAGGARLLEDIVGRPADGEYGHHNVWSRDGLAALCYVAGFRRIEALDPLADPRLTAPADWQCGVDVWR